MIDLILPGEKMILLKHIIIVHVALFLPEAPTEDEVAFFF